MTVKTFLDIYQDELVVRTYASKHCLSLEVPFKDDESLEEGEALVDLSKETLRDFIAYLTEQLKIMETK